MYETVVKKMYVYTGIAPTFSTFWTPYKLYDLEIIGKERDICIGKKTLFCLPYLYEERLSIRVTYGVKIDDATLKLLLFRFVLSLIWCYI